MSLLKTCAGERDGRDAAAIRRSGVAGVACTVEARRRRGSRQRVDSGCKRRLGRAMSRPEIKHQYTDVV